MRRPGRAGTERSRGSRGHVCCVHNHAAEFHRRLATFLTEGLREGLRVAYASGDPGAARADLAGVDDLDGLLSEGALHILSSEDVYGTGGPVDADEVVARYAAATEKALADGFRGLRVSADATALLRTPNHRGALARYEFLVDRYMAGHPLSALCGFGAEIGADTVAEFALLHDAGASDESAFRVFGCDDGSLGLAGQFDPVTVSALGRLLGRLRAEADDGVLVVDMADVEYVDHRLLLTVTDYALANGVALALRAAPPFAARLMELLPTSHLHRAEGRTEP